MAVDPEDPIELGGNLARELQECARQPRQLGLALFAQLGRSGFEQHLGLEHEAVADDADVRVLAEDLAQAAEELGAVARQFLHLAGERDVEAPAEVGDLDLLLLVLRIGGVENFVQPRQLLAQGRDLPVQEIDLALGRLGQLGLGGRRFLRRGRTFFGLGQAQAKLFQPLVRFGG